MQLAFCLYKFFPHGGIQRDLLKVTGECLGRGHEVRVYVIEWYGSVPEGVEVIRVPARGLTSPQKYRRFSRWVGEHLERHPVDLLVGMNKMPGLDVYYAGDSCYAEKAAVQRGALYRLLPRYRHFSRYERAVFDPAAATQILTLSSSQIPSFVRYYATPAERFHPLPPGIEPDRVAPADAPQIRATFRAEFDLAEEELLVLFVGSGFVKKGLDRVMRAFAALPSELAGRCRMFVLGQDKAGPFVRLSKKLSISDRVRIFSGRDDVPRFLLGADGFVLPAYDEAAGMVILEAMFAGLPALVTANCGYAAYLDEAGAGLIAPLPFEQATFNAQLVELLTSEQRLSWCERGRAAGRKAEFFQLPQKFADLLEQFAAARCG